MSGPMAASQPAIRRIGRATAARLAGVVFQRVGERDEGGEELFQRLQPDRELGGAAADEAAAAEGLERDVARGLDRVAHAAAVDGGMLLEGGGGFLCIRQSGEFHGEAAEFLGDVGQRAAGGRVGVDPPDDQA